MKNKLINKNDYIRLSGVIYSHDNKHLINVNGLVVSVSKINGNVFTGFSTNLKSFDFIIKNVEKIIFYENSQTKIKVEKPNEITVLREKLKNSTLNIREIKQIKKEIKKIQDYNSRTVLIVENTLF